MDVLSKIMAGQGNACHKLGATENDTKSPDLRQESWHTKILALINVSQKGCLDNCRLGAE